MKPAFTFKQFAIWQDRCAMKVGTDGVLLGAWARVEHCHRILDVGTGTGLVALMAAQRSEAHIVAIDLDAAAVEQAKENVAASPWGDRIQVIEADVRELDNCPLTSLKLLRSVEPASSLCSRSIATLSTIHCQLFDAILCNPPFFENSLKSPDAARSMARHTDTLSFDELARSVARWLTPTGEFSVIIPYDRATDMIISAACYGLFVTRQTIVTPVQGANPKRVLMAFTREGAKHSAEPLFIQDHNRQYTAEYIRLVEDFYLKL